MKTRQKTKELMDNTRKIKESLKVKIIGGGTYTCCKSAMMTEHGITSFITKDGKQIKTNAHCLITHPN